MMNRTVLGYRRRRKVGRRRKVARRLMLGHRRVRRLRRGGFLGNILKGVHSVVKSVPIVSAGLAASGNPMAAGVARSLGYGKRKKRGGYKRRGVVKFGGFRARGKPSIWGGRLRRPAVRRAIIRKGARRHRVRRGRGIMDFLKKAHDLVKDQKLISKGLALVPHSAAKSAAPVAAALGYGRRRVKRLGRRKRVRRGGMLSSLMGGPYSLIPKLMGRRRARRARAGARRVGRGLKRARVGRYQPNIMHF